MYDEFERAVTGKSGARLSFWGWLSIGLGTLFVLGIVAAGITAVHVKHRVAEIAHVIQHELEAIPPHWTRERERKSPGPSGVLPMPTLHRCDAHDRLS